MKRIVFVLLAACVIVLASTGVAFANFGPHGGYVQDTDACAGCHRAHTSFSTLGWTDLQDAQRASALLVSDATNMTDFCYACHGDGAPGASTNVQMGIFDSGPTGGAVGTVNPADPAATVFYTSNSSYDATLNGGGFEQLGSNAGAPVMSAHDMRPALQGDLVRWGAGTSAPSVMSQFRCTDCHDPHGSANYRLLKDEVNGVTVGGYDASGVPDPYVLSNEQGFPTGGFRKGDDGQADVAAYKPNYTSPQYAKNSGRAMSQWCSACHTAYASTDSTTNYFGYESVLATDGVTYIGTIGARMRHRHPVDVALEIGQGSGRGLNVEVLDDSGLPLEMGIGLMAPGATATSTKVWDARGNISCLTCHFAHGSSSTATGWAVAKLTTTPVGPAPVRVTPVAGAVAGTATPQGVNPNYSEAILRYDNRGVCERCHNK